MATYDLRLGIPEKLLTGDILNYPYRTDEDHYGGSLQMTLPKGIYLLEAWGCASGVEDETGEWQGLSNIGTGGYAKGKLTLSSGTAVFLRAGGIGKNGGKGTSVDYGYRSYIYGSGGASDIRIGNDTIYNRVLTAGGGGEGGSFDGDSPTALSYGGGGGGANGLAGGIGSAAKNGSGGTQTAGGANSSDSVSGRSYMAAAFGTGGYAYGSYGRLGTAGGGGWYGGGGSGYTDCGGGGGSGFAFSSATASSVPAGYALGSAYYLTETANKSGHDAGSPITEPDGSSHAGHQGSGYIRITVIQGMLDSPTVTGVTEPSQGTMRIAWNAVTNATGYQVYNGTGTLLGTVSASPWTETGITPNTEYTRKIVATSSSYASSDATTVNYLSKPKLATPTNLKATYAANETTVTWNAVTGATSYAVRRDGSLLGTVTGTSYADYSAPAGTNHTYTIVAKASGRWDSDPASVSTANKGQLGNVTNLTATWTASSVTLSWTAAANATNYDVFRDGTKIGNTTGSGFTDNRSTTGTTYKYTVVSNAPQYWSSSGASVNVQVPPRLATPDFLETSQTQSSTSLAWREADYGASVTFTLRRDGTQIYRGTGTSYTDTGLTARQTYVYTLTASIPGSGYYDSLPAELSILIGRDWTTIERQQDYLKSLRRPFTKLCRLRFLNPNGTTAFALDNNPKNKRSKTFIASGSVSANLQNGQRMSATVTLDNAGLEYETAVNKLWFGQEVALDEGLVLSNGEEYYRQTGVFLIDNPTEKLDPRDKTVTLRLLDKWAALDGTLNGNLEGTYEVEVGTNIFSPISSLLAEDLGNGRKIDGVAPCYTEYYNGMTQELTDGTTVSMVLSPYTLTVGGDGGTVAQVLLGLAAMVNAWIGYDNTGRLRIDPSQDDIIDAQKPVLWRFTPEETQILGAAYTVKKEDVYNDIIIVGEQLDDYIQPAGRATNYDPRSDTNVYLIGRKTRRESASGYATDTQCADLAEWKLKRSSILQRAVSISCIQMMHIDLNSLVEIVRTDKPGSPIERHLIQGYTRPLAYSGAMQISAVSVVDLPIATTTVSGGDLGG